MKLYYTDGGHVEKVLRKTVCLHVSASTQNVLIFGDSELFNNAQTHEFLILVSRRRRYIYSNNKNMQM